MIQDQDRSGFFGASDTTYVMGKWDTKTFRNWWLVKLGLNADHYTTRNMLAGTYIERAILDNIGVPRRDHQIFVPEYSLRINLDGDGPGRVYEIKTYCAENHFYVKKAYWQQVQVQCYGKYREEGKIPYAEIYAYGLLKEDYKNYFNTIKSNRLSRHPIVYNPTFIQAYLRRVSYLQKCLLIGVFPDQHLFNQEVVFR